MIKVSDTAKKKIINLMEDDLLILLDKIQSTKLEVGKDIGIISYNETPWKRFMLDGITTISTDFKQMGEMVANERGATTYKFILRATSPGYFLLGALGPATVASP